MSGRKADGALMERLGRHFAIRTVEDWRGGLWLPPAATDRHSRSRPPAARSGCSCTAADGEQLDVELLNDLVLRDGLGLTEEDLRRGRGVEYTHSAEAALASRRGQAGRRWPSS